MIVVADTSVILNLCRVRQERLLQALFKRVLIPEVVAGEFDRLAKVQTRFSGLILPEWIEILPEPQNMPAAVLAAHLDSGESAAIAMCLDRHADALLIDEALGREVAGRLGLRTIGVLGVLLEARRRELIPEVKIVLDKLETDAGFWIAPELKNRLLQLAGE
jgi:predicted nucleic acid-binding protein